MSVQELKGIRNIVFDLGGVILNIDYHLTSNAFRTLGFFNFDELYSKASQSGIFDKFETGEMNGGEFVEALNNLGTHRFTSQQIIDAWNAMLLDFPVKRLDLLEQLGAKYRLFLLSNTNEIHQEAFEKILRQETGKNTLEPWFEKVYYSHRIGLRKPDAAVFEFVLRQNALEPAETLFIDDSPQHVQGAIATGIQGVHLKDTTMEQLVTPLF